MLIHMLSQRLPPDALTGAPLQATQLAQALRQCGDQVTCFTTRPGNSRALADDQVRELRYPKVPGAVSMLRFGLAMRHANAIAAADIVHGHSLSPTVLGYALARPSSGPPLLVKPSLGGAHAEGELLKLTRVMPRAFLRRVLARIDAFAVLDDVIEHDLLSLGVAKERVYRLPNGVDTHRFRPPANDERSTLRARFSLPDERPVFVFAGQLSARKGVLELLEAWRDLDRSRVDPIIVVAGGGPLQCAVENAQAADQDRVRYLGELRDVTPVIRMADVLVLPSRSESFGNVLVEALCAGVPLVATAVGIAPKVLRDGVTGWFIDDVSAAGIRRALERSLNAAPNWARMQGATRAAAAPFDFSEVARAYRQVYDQLCAP